MCNTFSIMIGGKEPPDRSMLVNRSRIAAVHSRQLQFITSQLTQIDCYILTYQCQLGHKGLHSNVTWIDNTASMIPAVFSSVQFSSLIMLHNFSMKLLLVFVISSLQCESKKKSPPYGFLKIFPKRLGIFNPFFTHLLCYHLYTRLQIFIQISPTLTKLCHTKRDHLANFYISLEH